MEAAIVHSLTPTNVWRFYPSWLLSCRSLNIFGILARGAAPPGDARVQLPLHPSTCTMPHVSHDVRLIFQRFASSRTTSALWRLRRASITPWLLRSTAMSRCSDEPGKASSATTRTRGWTQACCARSAGLQTVTRGNIMLTAVN